MYFTKVEFFIISMAWLTVGFLIKMAMEQKPVKKAVKKNFNWKV